MDSIDQIIDRLVIPVENLLGHVTTTTENSATNDEITAWERNHGLCLPDDYKRFALRIGKCQLHGVLTILPLRSIGRFSDFVYGNIPDAPELPASWYAFAILGDSDYTVMDLATVRKDSVNIIDGFHEEANLSLEIIAKSFTEFLQRSIDDADVSTGGGNGHRYWSKPGPSYGETEHGIE